MSDEKIPAFREFCNDLYGKILESSKIVDVDEIFVNGDQFNFSLRPTDYDPTTKEYATRTYVPNDDPFAIHRYVIDFDISSILQENVIKQFLPEYAEYFSDINRFSPITAEELAQLKDILVKRSSFSNQFKGTKTAIEFVLSIFANAMGRYLISADPDPYHNFVYRISTDLSRDLWLKDVKPIVHPNGWGDRYILIVPDHPDYVQLRGEAEIAESIAHTPACFSYLTAGMAWDRLIHNDALARIDDYHTHYKFGFHPYAYFEPLNYLDSVRIELMRPGSFGVTIDRTSGDSVYTLTYNNPGVALEYVWTVYRYGVIVKEQHTFGPTFSFTSVDDSPFEVEVTLKRDDWTMTVGPWTLGVFNQPGLSTPENPAHSYANLTTEERRNQCFEMVNADNGDDHHTLRYHDSAYDGDMTDGWMSEPMTVLYDTDLALASNYQTNRVFYDGPEMVDQYIWSIEKNGHPLQILTTGSPEVIIATSEWETEPETVLGSQTWPHAGTKSGWTVTLTIKAGTVEQVVGSVTFGTMPDITAPSSFDFLGKPASQTNNTTATFTIGPNPDVAQYRWKLDNGTWSAPVERVGSVWDNLVLPSLGEGSHTLYYKATDSAGNWSVEWSYTWTVDTTAPIVTIVTSFGSVANHTNATLNVDSSSGDAVDYDYRVDGGAWSARRSFALDIVINSITEGSHTVEARGYDGAGNTATVSKTWTVDRTAPVVDITAGFPAVSPTNAQDYVFTVGGGGATEYQYRFDGGTWSAWTPIATPITLTNLYDGTHTINLLGRDEAGNTQVTMTTRTWVMESSRLEAVIPASLDYGSEFVITPTEIVKPGLDGSVYLFNRNNLTTPVRGFNYTPFAYSRGVLGIKYDEVRNKFYILSSASSFMGNPTYRLHEVDATTLVQTKIITVATNVLNKFTGYGSIWSTNDYVYVPTSKTTIAKYDKNTFTLQNTVTLSSTPPDDVISSINKDNIVYLVSWYYSATLSSYNLDTGALIASVGIGSYPGVNAVYDPTLDRIILSTGLYDPVTLSRTFSTPISARVACVVPGYMFIVELPYYNNPLQFKKFRLSDGALVQTITINTMNTVGTAIYDSFENRFWTYQSTGNLIVINP